MTSGWWRARIAAHGERPAVHLVIESNAHPDGTLVELGADVDFADWPEGWLAAAEYRADGEVARLEVAEHGTARPPLWFAEIRESAARPPAVNLLAYSGHGVAAGALLDRSALSNVAVTRDDQLAAVRWYPGTGEVDQVYVAPAWRRHGVGSALIAAAACLTGARGWSRMWGDGQRTAIGEQFRNASTWRHRTAELTHVAPPMTPGESA
jgi:GNAT superfamily N-acetyltransferase